MSLQQSDIIVTEWNSSELLKSWTSESEVNEPVWTGNTGPAYIKMYYHVMYILTNSKDLLPLPFYLSAGIL